MPFLLKSHWPYVGVLEHLLRIGCFRFRLKKLEMNFHYTNDVLKVQEQLELKSVSHILVKNGSLKTVSA